MLAALAPDRSPGTTSPDALCAGEDLIRLRAGAFRLLVPLRHVARVLPAALPAARPSARPEAPVVALPGGALVPVIFAGALLGEAEVRLAPEHQMVLLGGGERRALLWVDGVEDVVPHLPAAEGGAGLGLASGEPPLLAGWSDPARPLAVLDVPRLLDLASPRRDP